MVGKLYVGMYFYWLYAKHTLYNIQYELVLILKELISLKNIYNHNVPIHFPHVYSHCLVLLDVNVWDSKNNIFIRLVIKTKTALYPGFILWGLHLIWHCVVFQSPQWKLNVYLKNTNNWLIQNRKKWEKEIGINMKKIEKQVYGLKTWINTLVVLEKHKQLINLKQ